VLTETALWLLPEELAFVPIVIGRAKTYVPLRVAIKLLAYLICFLAVLVNRFAYLN